MDGEVASASSNRVSSAIGSSLSGERSEGTDRSLEVENSRRARAVTALVDDVQPGGELRNGFIALAKGLAKLGILRLQGRYL